MKKFLLKFLRDESGPSAAEYAVMLALIIGTCLAAITSFGGQAGGTWHDTSQKIDAAVNGGS
jgi:pilus assembly protein Flp/PilA